MKYQPPYNNPSHNPELPYVDQDALNGVEGSALPAKAAEHPQREIVNFIADTGIHADENNLRQLGESVQQGTVWYGDDTGTTNHIVVTLTPICRQYFKGMAVKVVMANDITGPTDININEVGAVAAKQYQADLGAGVLLTGDSALFLYDGACFELIGGARSPADVIPPGPIYLVAPRILYVNATTGDDILYDGTTATPSGSGHGPFKTIQRAVNETYKYNLNGYDFTIYVADGSYDGNVRCEYTNGAGRVHIIGNTTTPGNCMVTGKLSPYVTSCFNCLTGNWEIKGFRLKVNYGQIYTDSGYGVVAQSGATVWLSSLQFGAVPSVHIIASNGSFIVIQAGNIIIEAGATAQAHCCAISNGIVAVSGVSTLRPTLIILGTVSISEFALSEQAWLNLVYRSVSGSGFVYGYKYEAVLNGIINTTGMGTGYFPGTLPGFISSGGQYV